VDLVVAALTVIVSAIGPGGLLVVCVAVLLIQLTDTIGDLLDEGRRRAAGRQH
jgi:hypothetical protein